MLNGPIAVNTAELPQEIIDKLIEGLTSDEVSNDELLFAPEDNEDNGAVWSKGDTAGFIAVEDSWYDPIRELN